ncbi:hypothetical protein SDJN03_17926, partial [Cucurbita argyrosperma subsp. sororia]
MDNHKFIGWNFHDLASPLSFKHFSPHQPSAINSLAQQKQPSQLQPWFTHGFCSTYNHLNRIGLGLWGVDCIRVYNINIPDASASEIADASSSDGRPAILWVLYNILDLSLTLATEQRAPLHIFNFNKMP